MRCLKVRVILSLLVRPAAAGNLSHALAVQVIFITSNVLYQSVLSKETKTEGICAHVFVFSVCFFA